MARQSPEHLRVALLVYRGNPHSGGQGVYTRYLSRELAALGHRVTVFAGQPWPELDAGVGWVPVPSLDLYREPDPFRVPRLREFRSAVDMLEFGLICTGGFPEPLTFSLRVRQALAARRGEFDVVHDNQCFGWGMLGVMADGWPTVATLHHPITVDRALDLSHAATWRKRLALRRWYGFLSMQKQVARRVPRIMTVSDSSRRDIVAQMGVRPSQLVVVPVGVDHTRFRPLSATHRVPGRIMTTASADVPLKGLVPLLEAVAKVRTERAADLVVIGRPRPDSRVEETIERLGLGGAVRFVSGASDERIVELYAEASVAVVPSLYEGFSLPAVEAMACGVPLVATTGGALPEVVGPDGVTGLLVPPGDPGALAVALGRVLDEPELAARLSAAGRRRVLERFTWRACALASVEHYRDVVDRAGGTRGGARTGRGGAAGARGAGGKDRGASGEGTAEPTGVAGGPSGAGLADATGVAGGPSGAGLADARGVAGGADRGAGREGLAAPAGAVVEGAQAGSGGGQADPAGQGGRAAAAVDRPRRRHAAAGGSRWLGGFRPAVSDPSC